MSSPPESEAGFHPEAADRIEPYVWKIAGVVILGMIMSILDTTIVNVALRTLGHDLHSSISQVQWVVTGYLLSLAAVIPITGWAARRFGAKRVYMVSLVLFTAGSALCAVAASTTTLVLFRVLQGVGGGMIMPIGQLIMAQIAGPKRMGRVMAIVSMPAMLAPILGPVVGGAILEKLHWSWIFLVNVPIGAIALLFAWRMLPKTDSEGHEREPQRIGSIADADGVLGSVIDGQLPLEPLEHGPHHVIPGLQDLLDVAIYFSLDVVILADVTIKADIHVGSPQK